MTSHYIPAFATRGPGRSEMAICGEFVTLHQHATEPTCEHCQALIKEEAEQIEALKAPSDPSLLVQPEEFDTLAGYKPRTR